MINLRKSAWGFIGLSFAICIALTVNYAQMWKDDTIIPGSGVTEVKWLSDYLPELYGTLGDTRVFIMDSGKPGGTFLVFGGTHADENAANATALILVEYCKVSEGRLIVLPHNANTGFTQNYPQEAHPQFIHYERPDGTKRKFRYGSRTGNSAEHWPDPEVFIHYPSGQQYSGEECRNPNRAYPGRIDGTFSERVAFGIQQLIRTEHVDMQLDMHEGQPEYPFINALSGHPNSQDLVTFTTLDMQMYDIAIGAEISPDSFRGLSNLEMGDLFPHMYALTSETVNPTQGKFRGITDANLPIHGQDAFYDKVAPLGYLFAPWEQGVGSPVELRAGRNIQEIQSLCVSFTELTGKPISFETIPSYTDLLENGVGYYLSAIPADFEEPGFRALPGAWRLITQRTANY